MNAIHPSTSNADLPESVSPTVSAHARKLKSWEFNSFVQSYQTYTSPGSAMVAARLADMYNSEKGYSYETQRDIAKAVGYEITAVKKYLKEIEATGLWTFVVGKRGTATRYYPIPSEIVRANMFIEYRMAGKLSALPFKPVPRFILPKRERKVGGFAKTASEAKKARDIREAAEAAALEPVATAVPSVSNTPALEHEYEISAYTPDDMPEFVIPEEPDDYFDAPADTHAAYMPVPQVEATEHIATLTTTPLATITSPAVVIDDGCPF